MKFKRSTITLTLVLAVGVLVLGLTAWATYPRKPKRSLADLDKYKYMHCKDCPYESMYSLDGIEKECPACGSDRGLIPTIESVKQKAGMSPYARMGVALFAELVVLMGAVWLVLRPRITDGEVSYRYMRCPNCTQKLRFRESQVGYLGACSRCKRAFLFPPGVVKEKELDGFEENEVYDEDDGED